MSYKRLVSEKIVGIGPSKIPNQKLQMWQPIQLRESTFFFENKRDETNR